MSARIWVVSDTHFGHENIYKFLRQDGVTRVRPEFSGANEADREMILRWNALVTPQCHVWHLGDVAFGAPENLHLVKHLNGHLRLILGNHDKRKIQEYMAVGFQKIQASHYVDGAWLTHIPVHPDGLYNGRINIHGHIHEKHVMLPEAEASGLMGVRDRRYVNVAVEQTDYRPILLAEARARATG